MRTACCWLLLWSACGTPATGPAAAPSPAPTAPPPAPAPVAAGPLVVFLGDSLTAGLGLSEQEAFPALLGRQLADAGVPVRVVNAGVSGDTTAGGLRRMDWLLGQHPDVLVVALGGNDTLRGLSPADTAANLKAIAVKAQAAGSDVLLLGLRANPTLGPDYVAAFDPIWPSLAAELGVPLVPFLLEGVVEDPTLLQADGLHPTAAGQSRVAALVLPALEPLVRRRAERASAP